MAGSIGRIKTVKKSSHWSKHGKSKGRVVRSVEINREMKKRERLRAARAEKMYPTVYDAFHSK